MGFPCVNDVVKGGKVFITKDLTFLVPAYYLLLQNQLHKKQYPGLVFLLL